NNISTIKEVIVLPADVDGLLIPSAKVAMIFELNAAGSPVEGTKWITNSHTDSVGFFETGALANPEKKKFGWT
ncbi:hypothetical protein JW960_22690, partial [candidate division KSB1 bacterium]|nr:hypothetical protein [candidate division KSB1 bacterium]